MCTLLCCVVSVESSRGAGSRGAARQSGVGHMQTRISPPSYLPPSLLMSVSLSILVAVSQITSNKQHMLHTHEHTHTQIDTVAGNLVA